MNYKTNELTCELPPELKDKTVNIFSLTDDGPSEFSLVINRAPLPAGSDLALFVTRQLKQFMDSLPAFKLLAQRDTMLANNPAYLTEYTWKSGTDTLHQKQIALVFEPANGPAQVIMIAGTCSGVFSTRWASAFSQILDSVRLN